MSLTPSDQRALRTIYCNLMDEIRHRIEIISKTLDGNYQIPVWPAFELCYLQLRMICELIALGALAVHGDIPAARTKRMRGQIKADWIINALEKLHPPFYPTPGRQIIHPDGGRQFIPIVGDYLTKPKFLKLYRQCGEVLHRGSFKNMHKLPDLNLDAIGDNVLRIAALLSFHRIALLGTENELWVAMQSEQTGKVQATLVGSGEHK
jgi:hypothetical protein